MRFNTLPTKEYEDKVGTRTTIRFLNHARSLAMCHVREPAPAPPLCRQPIVYTLRKLC